MAPCWNGHREARATSAQNARNNGLTINIKYNCAIAIFNVMIAIKIIMHARKRRRDYNNRSSDVSSSIDIATSLQLMDKI